MSDRVIYPLTWVTIEDGVVTEHAREPSVSSDWTTAFGDGFVTAAEVEALRKERDKLGRDLNAAKYGEPDFAWSIHKAAMADLQTALAASQAEVVALRKERDSLRDEASRYAAECNQAINAFAASQAEVGRLRGFLEPLSREEMCRCMYTSRDTERAYENGECIHQRARAAMQGETL